ncbi:MAG: glycoside hydrolase family 3 C-terminal domain-containing protein [Clostridia bacterium]|nr:glycoside hydrolase family 3 C-terminal domain-containing protein [Clostridia bacterium]
MKLKVGHYIQFGIIAVLIAVIIVANSILLEPTLAQNITGLLCAPSVSAESLAADRASGQALSEQIVTEGVVLTKNNGVLPLDRDEASEVNVFGHSSIDWVYGGSGSGRVVPESASKPGDNVDLLKALKNFGVNYNEGLENFYKTYSPAVGDTDSINTFFNQFYVLCEPAMNEYSQALLNQAQSFSDVAFVVIGRKAGETEDPTRIQYKNKASSNDSSRHYLEISTEEEALLRYVGEKFENVIVIVNSTNTMELDFVDTIPGIDACLVVGATGTRGANAIPYVLYGENADGDLVSPSGKFADTYPYELSSNVNYLRTSSQGIGHYTGVNSSVYPVGASSNAGVATRQAPAFIDYIENVYLGYKWYETADVEGIWNSYQRDVLDEQTGAAKRLSGYQAVVQYPFGYGLSYTQFKWTVHSLSVADNSAINDKSKITVELSVENVGEYPGQDVVEVYVTPPYYRGGVEKPSVNLVGFAKTNVIQPGENEMLSITLDVFDFASYDAYNLSGSVGAHGGYVLEHGEYQVKLMTDSHTVKKIDYLTGSKNVDGVITYRVDNNIVIDKDPVTEQTVSNLFTGADSKEVASLDGRTSDQNIGFISRSSLPDPKTISALSDRAWNATIAQYNTYSKDDGNAWDGASTDLWGNAVANSSVTWNRTSSTTYSDSVGSDGKAKVYKDGKVTSLGMQLGKDYNDPLWNSVLDQITIDEAKAVIYQGSFGNAAVNSIGKPRLADYDGPNQVRSFNAGNERGTGFPTTTVLAQTWNKKLAYTFGLNYGKEMTTLSVDGAYAFGANMHRSAWGGRNYEYFSEDATLSAEMLTQQVKALKNTGHYCYLKHLILYETEHERDAMYTWCNEQALREIYLKPFRKAIQEGGCVGIMTSYNRIGNVWTGGCETLITKLLRNEYGFNGLIITDYCDGWGLKYMAIEDAVRAGGDILLGGKDDSLASAYNSNASARFQNQIREVVHHATYAFLSSRYQNAVYNEADDVDSIVIGSVVESWEWWKIVLYDLDILVGGICLFWVYAILRKTVLKKFFDGDAETPDSKATEG